MSITAKSYEDVYQKLLDLPENMVGEIIGGELHTQPRPAPKHALTSSVLGAELGAPYSIGRGGPGGWRILDEPEIHLGKEVVVPDISGWKKGRAACPNCPKPIISNWPRIGCAKSCPRARPKRTGSGKCRSTANMT